MEEGRSFLAACVGWYGCISLTAGVDGSLSAGHKYTDPTEGPVGTWGVHL